MVIETIGGLYLHSAYATDAVGSDFSLTYFDGALYLGNYTDSSQTESTNPAMYTWRVLGEVELNGATDLDLIINNEALIEYLDGVDVDLQAGITDSEENLQNTQAAQDDVAKIANSTAQYFWVAEEGEDTGAHITEIPREDFEADPSNGGGNLLARSNGIAVRDGLSELAQFGADGIRLGESGALSALTMDAETIEMKTAQGASFFRVNATSETVTTEAVVAQAADFSLLQPDETVTLAGSLLTGAAITVPNYRYAWSTQPVQGTITPTAISATSGTAAFSVSGNVTTTSWESPDITFAYGTARTVTATVTVTCSEGQLTFTSTVAYDGSRTISFTHASSASSGMYAMSLAAGGHHDAITALISDATAPSFTLGTRVGVEGGLSFSSGFGLYATQDYQSVFGKFNVEDTSGDYALIVGNGADDTTRKNAFAVDWSGDIYPRGVQMVDYVVEEGTGGSAYWKYRKWASGRIEAWYSRTFDTQYNFNTRGGSSSYYWTNSTWTSYSVAMPSGLFNSISNVALNVGASGYVNQCISSYTTSAVVVRLWTNYSTSPTIGTVSIYVVGE